MSSLKKITSAVMSIFDYAHGTNFWLIFLFLFLYQITLGSIRMEFIATDAIYAQHVDAQLSSKYGDLMDEFEEDIEDFEDFEEETFSELLTDQVVAALLSLLSLVFMSLVFVIGFSFQSEDISYFTIFKVVTISSFIFLVPRVIELIWFLFMQTDYTFAVLQSFKPFSLYSLLPSDAIATWMVYPLKTLNLFEVIFVFLVAVGVTQYTSVKLNKSISIVSITYALLLLTLIIIRIYLSLMFSRL